MAKKGLRYVAFGKLQADGTYLDGRHLSPAVNFNVTANNSDVKDYGDDRVVETDKTTTSASISVELNNDVMDLYTYLLGHEETDGKVVSNVDDVAPFVGAGAIGLSGNKWVCKVYYKCQFAEPGDENTTKEEQVTFNHITLEGDVLIPEDGNWKERKEFDTEAAAKAYLNELFNVTEGGETGDTGDTGDTGETE